MPEDRIYEDLTARPPPGERGLLGHRRPDLPRPRPITGRSRSWTTGSTAGLAEANRIRMRVLAAPRGAHPRPERRDPGRQQGLLQGLAHPREHQGRGRVLRRGSAGCWGSTSRRSASAWTCIRTCQLFEPIVIVDDLDSGRRRPHRGPPARVPRARRRDRAPAVPIPSATLAAHVLGYLQEQTPEEIRARPERKVRAGEMVGKTGVEREYDDVLKGEDGAVYRGRRQPRAGCSGEKATPVSRSRARRHPDDRLRPSGRGRRGPRRARGRHRRPRRRERGGSWPWPAPRPTTRTSSSPGSRRRNGRELMNDPLFAPREPGHPRALCARARSSSWS